MSTSKLNAKEKRSLRSSSRLSVEAYFQSLTDAQKSTEWLEPSNRYRIDCTKRYSDDFKAKPRSVNHAALIDYISASAPAHVIDGWSILGRAVDATLRSDTHSAIHLAYYAELRAAMAVLASEGIGIFDRLHPRACKAKRTAAFSRQSTHRVIWPCLHYWASCEASMTAIDRAIRPGQISLDSWFTAFNISAPATAVTRRLFGSWGVDLKILSDDRELRNLASYRPSEFNLPPAISIDETLDFVVDLWACFEPAGAGRFSRLEKFLLRRVLLAAELNTAAVTPSALAAAGIPQGESGAWFAALTTAPEPLLFREAMVQSEINSPKCHLQVIARASILLAVATAAIRHELVTAGYTAAHLQFWWERIGRSRGLWDTAASPPVLTDAWADVRDRIDETAQWRSANPGAPSMNRWRRAQTAAVELLGAFELVAMWALMP
jgi:hypothetical protein